MRSTKLVVSALLLAACDSTRPPATPTPPLSAPSASVSVAAAPTSSAPVAASAPQAPASAVPATPPPSPANPAAAFNARMYQKLAAQPGNLMFSSVSLTGALGIAYLGARGDTAKEMASAIGFDADPARASANAKAEKSRWITAANKAELAIANRLWVDRTFALKSDYVKTANDAWGAAVEPADFVKNADAQRTLINQWVGQQTKGKIPELFGQGMITPATRVVITNAVYFKGNWASAFPKARTADEVFQVDGKTATKVPMMHQSEHLGFASLEGATMLELPYKDSDLAMDIVLPNAPDGLASLEQSLTADSLATWAGRLASGSVNVSLPRFTFKWGGSVTKQLNDLGITRAFRDGADFSGITSAPSGLTISEVVHKTFIAVDETGTEAAAATGISMMPSAIMVPHEFKADHPFLFAIRDRKSGQVLFMGRVVNPKG